MMMVTIFHLLRDFRERHRSMRMVRVRAQYRRQHFAQGHLQQDPGRKTTQDALSQQIRVPCDAEADDDAEGRREREGANEAERLARGDVRHDAEGTDGEPLEELVNRQHDEERTRGSVRFGDAERDADDDGVDGDADFQEVELDERRLPLFFFLVAADAFKFFQFFHAVPIQFGGEDVCDANRGKSENHSIRIRFIIFICITIFIVIRVVITTALIFKRRTVNDLVLLRVG